MVLVAVVLVATAIFAVRAATAAPAGANSSKSGLHHPSEDAPPL